MHKSYKKIEIDSSSLLLPKIKSYLTRRSIIAPISVDVDLPKQHAAYSTVNLSTVLNVQETDPHLGTEIFDTTAKNDVTRIHWPSPLNHDSCLPTQTVACAEENSSKPCRKRVLSSYDVQLPSPKRINKVSNEMEEISCQSISSGSRGLATAEACQVTSQQPRGVLGISCLSQKVDNQVNARSLKKRAKKRKTRRGKKKCRKFLKKVIPVCDLTSNQQQPGNNTGHIDYTGYTNICNTGETNNTDCNRNTGNPGDIDYSGNRGKADKTGCDRKSGNPGNTDNINKTGYNGNAGKTNWTNLTSNTGNTVCTSNIGCYDNTGESSNTCYTSNTTCTSSTGKFVCTGCVINTDYTGCHSNTGQNGDTDCFITTDNIGCRGNYTGQNGDTDCIINTDCRSNTGQNGDTDCIIKTDCTGCRGNTGQNGDTDCIINTDCTGCRGNTGQNGDTDCIINTDCIGCRGNTGQNGDTDCIINTDCTGCRGNTGQNGDTYCIINNDYTGCRGNTGHTGCTGHKDDGENLLILITKENNGPVYAISKDESRILGRGSFGIVYKGYKIEGTRKTPVAIKVIQKSSIKNVVEDEEFGRVPKEVSMMNKIKGHPNAIQLIDYIQMHNYVAIIMERPLNCKDLFDIREQQASPMSENHARKIIKQLNSVLLAMEKKHLIHRDIKCENVLVDLDNGQVKLIDFGLATAFKSAESMKTFSGTRANTPPEFVLTGEYEGPKDTVWTLGLLLYTLVCGDEPFTDMLDASVRPVSIPPHFSPDLKDLLLGMLRKNPIKRLTLEQVQNHPWMTTQTNSLFLPFGYRRCFKQKY